MSDEIELNRSDRAGLARVLRQRLESLRRAGVDRMPAPPVLAPARPAVVRPPAAPEPVVTAPPPPTPTPTSRPVRPSPPVAPVLTPAASLFEAPGLSTSVVVLAAERPGQLEALRQEVAACTKCPLLAETRTQTVFGDGSPTARLMFVGEAPGADEDRQGVPFVGASGQLLNDMITKGMGLSRDEVYIANVLKSRPPGNRNPLPDEIGHCLPFLERQIAIVRPEFLCLLGKVAASTLLETALTMGRLRGRWHQYRGIPTVVTYHPSYLLRTPSAKKEAWDDLQMLMRAMGLKPPERKKG